MSSFKRLFRRNQRLLDWLLLGVQLGFLAFSIQAQAQYYYYTAPMVYPVAYRTPVYSYYPQSYYYPQAYYARSYYPQTYSYPSYYQQRPQYYANVYYRSSGSSYRPRYVSNSRYVLRTTSPAYRNAGYSHTAYTSYRDEDSRTEAISGCPDGRCGLGYRGRRVISRIPVPRPRPLAVPNPRRMHVAAQMEVAAGGALPHASAIQRAINSGVGRGAGNGMCGRAVWRILHRAGLVRGSFYSSGVNYAKNFGPLLRRNGFRLDMNKCNSPGVVRVYDGNRSGRRFPYSMVGDRAGHIEILGLDRNYHSFYDSGRSISQSMQARYGYASRRPLIQCWYKP